MGKLAPLLCGAARCAGSPRRAVPGLRLCSRCAHNIAADAVRLARLDAALLDVLVGSCTRNSVVASGPGDGLSLNEAAAEARTAIVRLLVRVCRGIGQRRGIEYPRTATVMQAAHYIGRHATWLAAQHEASTVADALAELVRRGRPVAYPSGTRLWGVRLPDGSEARCPHFGCEGYLWTVLRPDDAPQPSELVCGLNPEHRWESHQWLRLGRRLVRETAS